MESCEPPKPTAVQLGDGDQRGTVPATQQQWSEEERRNVVTFFTLLDQWDRQLRKNEGVA